MHTRCAREGANTYMCWCLPVHAALWALATVRGPPHAPNLLMLLMMLMLLTEHDECCLTWLNQQFLH